MWYHFDSMKWLNAIKSFFSPGKKGAEGMSLWPMYGAGALFSTRTMVQNHSQALLALHENQKIILSMVRGRGANVDLPPLFEVKSTKPN
jgi:hypothetical protein